MTFSFFPAAVGTDSKDAPAASADDAVREKINEGACMPSDRCLLALSLPPLRYRDLPLVFVHLWLRVSALRNLHNDVPCRSALQCCFATRRRCCSGASNSSRFDRSMQSSRRACCCVFCVEDSVVGSFLPCFADPPFSCHVLIAELVLPCAVLCVIDVPLSRRCLVVSCQSSFSRGRFRRSPHLFSFALAVAVFRRAVCVEGLQDDRVPARLDR